MVNQLPHPVFYLHPAHRDIDQQGELVAAHPADQAVLAEEQLHGHGRLLQDPIPLRMPVEVVDLLELIQIHHEEVAGSALRPVEPLQELLACREKCLAGQHAGEGVHPGLPVDVGGITAVEDQENDHQRHHGEDAEQELDLQVHQIRVSVLRDGDPLLAQCRGHPVNKIQRHRHRGEKRQKDHAHQGQDVVALRHLGGLRALHPLYKFTPGLGAHQAPEQQNQPGLQQVGEHSVPGQQGLEGIGRDVARLREKEPHHAIDQCGMDMPPQIGDHHHSDSRVPCPPGRGIEQAGQQAEQGPADHAEKNAAHRVAAHNGGKELIEGHGIAGGGLPHAGQTENRPHSQGIQRPQHRPGQQNRKVGGGDGDRLHVEIPQEREGHQQLQCHQGSQQIPADSAAFSLLQNLHDAFLPPSSFLYIIYILA